MKEKKKSKKAVILTSTTPENNPRVVKEAGVLLKFFDCVEVLTTDVNPNNKDCVYHFFIENNIKLIKTSRENNGLVNLIDKVKRGIGKYLYRFFGLASNWQYGSSVQYLLNEARKRNGDLYIAHLEAALVVGDQLQKEGKIVGVDMEDWYSEDLLPEARKYRPLNKLQKLERTLLCKGNHSTCPSNSMADALVKTYGCPRPVVIRNVFPFKDLENLDKKWADRPWMSNWLKENQPELERPKGVPISIHWFSQTIGPGRGLEELFNALDGLPGNWELHLRGNIKGYEKWLENCCPEHVFLRLTLHLPVKNDELLSRISEHDIGYAGELKNPASRDLTITNKFFQYLQAGLGVLANNSHGQIEGEKYAPGAVMLFDSNKTDDLRKKIFGLISNGNEVFLMKQKALAIRKTINWEIESKHYESLVANLL